MAENRTFDWYKKLPRKQKIGVILALPISIPLALFYLSLGKRF